MGLSMDLSNSKDSGTVFREALALWFTSTSTSWFFSMSHSLLEWMMSGREGGRLRPPNFSTFFSQTKLILRRDSVLPNRAITCLSADHTPPSGYPSAVTMSTPVFNKVPLQEELGCDFPLSLPLVLPSNCSYDFNTHQLIDSNRDEPSDEPVELKLVPETVKLLQGISKPVAVLSICGPFRSGKSYFLSRMLGARETFQLGHTMEACTRGIWMASSLLECEEFVLILLDTEGIDAPDKVTKLLVLTMLLSSMFIYNSKNVPRSRDLKRMR